MAKQQSYHIYGLNTVLSVILNSPERVLQLFIDNSRRDDRIERIKQTAQSIGLNPQSTNPQSLAKQLGEVNHQGVMALVKPAAALKESALLDQIEQTQNIEHQNDASRQPPLLLCLDGVQDPHNLGACLRSADAAGVDAVIAPRDRACGINATVCKVASGAAETMPFYTVTNLSRCLRDIQQLGVWCIGLAGEAESDFYQIDLRGPMAIVLGAEGSGLRRLTRETCDELTCLPMLGSVSSLNVSVTAGITLYEAVRQRQTPK